MLYILKIVSFNVSVHSRDSPLRGIRSLEMIMTRQKSVRYIASYLIVLSQVHNHKTKMVEIFDWKAKAVWYKC